MRYAMLISCALIMSGCAIPIGTLGTKEPPVCAVWSEISWSKKDTDQTIREVKINNARREGYCLK